MLGFCKCLVRTCFGGVQPAEPSCFDHRNYCEFMIHFLEIVIKPWIPFSLISPWIFLSILLSVVWCIFFLSSPFGRASIHCRKLCVAHTLPLFLNVPISVITSVAVTVHIVFSSVHIVFCWDQWKVFAVSHPFKFLINHTTYFCMC